MLKGTEVANLHAGWRGLAGGIVENTIAAMQLQPTWAWLGAADPPAIVLKLAQEVKASFLLLNILNWTVRFRPVNRQVNAHADLYAIARYLLQQHGVECRIGWGSVFLSPAGGILSLIAVKPKTGRMATFVFMA